MYQIYTNDFYKDISYDIETKFDTSDYSPNHPSGILTGVRRVNQVGDYVSYCSLPCTLYESIN